MGADSCLYPLQACQRDQVDCVLLLLMHGADINSAGESTRTTIEHCQQPGLLVVSTLAQALQAYRSLALPLDVDGNTPLHMCAANGHDRCAKVVMWHAPQILRINARNGRGDTPLHVASTWGYSR